MQRSGCFDTFLLSNNKDRHFTFLKSNNYVKFLDSDLGWMTKSVGGSFCSRASSGEAAALENIDIWEEIDFPLHNILHSKISGLHVLPV